MATFWRFLGPAFPASCSQHISDLHSKFAPGPHPYVEVWQTSNLQRLILGEEKKKKERRRRRKKPQGKNLMACPIT